MTDNDGSGACDIEGSELVFVTSSDLPGAMGGIDDADVHCNKLAQDANLAGSYSAWISVDDKQQSPIDAVARVSNGPFRMVDGTIFSSSLDVLTSRGVPEVPLHVTEWNEDRRGVGVWTATTSAGLAYPESCGAWSSATGEAVAGNSSSATSAWTAAGEVSCDRPLALYCFQDDGTCPGGCQAPLQCISGACGLYAFVTRQTFNGNLTGIDGADSICTSAAKDAGLPGLYSAWLSDRSVEAPSRVENAPYYRPDGLRIARDLAHLSAPDARRSTTPSRSTRTARSLMAPCGRAPPRPERAMRRASTGIQSTVRASSATRGRRIRFGPRVALEPVPLPLPSTAFRFVPADKSSRV